MATWHIQPTGGDYSSLVSAEAAINTGTLSEIENFVCHPMIDTAALVIAGAITSASAYINIIAFAGAEAQMPFNNSGTSYTLDPGVSGGQITLQDDYTRLNNIQIKMSYSGSGFTIGIRIDYSNATLIDSCHINGNSIFTTDNFYGFLNLSTGNNSTVRNCFCGDLQAAGGGADGTSYYENVSGGSSFWYNNLSYGNVVRGFWMKHANQNTTVLNNISVGSSGLGYDGTFNVADYNASDDATTPGTNALTNQNFDFISATDYHLASLLPGQNLSAVSIYPFNTDFDLKNRINWDRGPTEAIITAEITPSARVQFIGA